MAKASLSLDEALLDKPEEAQTKTSSSNETITSFVEEVKMICYLAGPNAIVNLSLYFLQVISEMMVGHLGKLYLSSTAIAISFCVVTGFSLIVNPHFPLEWWAYEFLTLMSELLPNSKLEASVLAVCFATTATIYTIPDGLASAISTRISNELGAGRPQAARRALNVVIFLTASVAVAVSSTLFVYRDLFGYVFSNEKEVIEYVTSMAPLICLRLMMNTFQAVFAGVARGSGWQKIGAYVNLATFYLCGIPVAVLLAFWMQLRGKGFWIGILVGVVVQMMVMVIIITCQDWEKQAKKARERICEGKSVNESDKLLLNREA